MQQQSFPSRFLATPADPASSALDVLWRELLVAYHGTCAISGCQVRAVLRPTLIDPQGPLEPHNALLLRADLQLLFQAGLLTVDAMTLEVLIAPELRDSEYGLLVGRRLRQPERLALRPSRQLLAVHHRLFQLEQPIPPARVSQQPLLYQILAVQSWVSSVAFSPDQQILATGSWDGMLRLWNLPDIELRQAINGHIGEINAIAFSPDSQLVAAAGRLHGVRVWRVADGTFLFHLGDPKRHGACFSVAFQPQGHVIATGGWDQVIYLWDRTDGQSIGTFVGHEGLINSLTFSPDGSLLFSVGYDRIVRVWRMADRSLMYALRGHGDTIFSVAASPDGSLAASASADGMIFIWRVTDGQPLQVLSTPAGACFGLAFSPNGRYLASAHYGRVVCIWQISDGTLRWELGSHNESVTCVAFAPNGHLLASGSYDSTVRIWSFQ